MATIKQIYDFIDRIAPFDRAFSFDNCGLLVGNQKSEVAVCIVALDMTASVLEFAKRQKADLIITHHPVIFNPMRSVRGDDLVYQLIQNNIAVISAHTNLDISEGGVNDCLAKRLCLTDIIPFENEDNIGRVGALPHAMSCREFAAYVKEKISAKAVHFTDCNRQISTVAVLGGEGSDFVIQSQSYDAYLTGEVKYHIYSQAQNAGIQLFVAGHYETEAVVLEPLKAIFSADFTEVGFHVYDNSDVQSV